MRVSARGWDRGERYQREGEAARGEAEREESGTKCAPKQEESADQQPG
jgi:hypothetical protein